MNAYSYMIGELKRTSKLTESQLRTLELQAQLVETRKKRTVEAGEALRMAHVEMRRLLKKFNSEKLRVVK